MKLKRTDPLRLSAEAAISGTLRHFISRQQLSCVRELMKDEEGDFFASKMIELDALIRAMPKTYEQDGKGDEAIVSLHYFAGGSGNWWITERDFFLEESPTDVGDEQDGGQHQAFGLANFFGGPNDQDAELGYISIAEIIASGGELDFHFQPRTLRELKAGKLDSKPTPAVAAALVRAL
jgi:hypothetical protein